MVLWSSNFLCLHVVSRLCDGCRTSLLSILYLGYFGRPAVVCAAVPSPNLRINHGWPSLCADKPFVEDRRKLGPGAERRGGKKGGGRGGVIGLRCGRGVICAFIVALLSTKTHIHTRC